MNLPSAMVLFARVVDAGSFTAASRALNQSPSAVSKQIAHLEDHVGVRLLQRLKTGVVLTEDGEEFYRHCVEIRKRVEAAEELVMSFGSGPAGLLHVASTVAFGKSQLLPILPAFLKMHPGLRISLTVTDRKVNRSEEHVDVEIRFTEQIIDQSLYARKIAHNRRVLCASPEYLARHGTPSAPSDLETHNCLRLTSVATFNDWSFADLEKSHPAVSGDFETSSTDALYQATLNGMGISRLSTYLIYKDLAAGRLVRILPDYEDNGSDLFAVYAERKNLPPKVRVFIDFLVEQFSPVPPWELEKGAGIQDDSKKVNAL